MLETVKLALRYSNTLFDDETNGLIEAAKNDLNRVGVGLEHLEDDSMDATIKHAIICYCKWMTNFQKNGEKWGNLYRELRQDIAMDGDYKCHQQ